MYPDSGTLNVSTKNSIGGFGSLLPATVVVVISVPPGVDVVVDPEDPGAVVDVEPDDPATVVVVDDEPDDPGVVVEVDDDPGIVVEVEDVVVGEDVVGSDGDEVVVVGSGQNPADQLIVVVVVKNGLVVDVAATLVVDPEAATAASPTHNTTCEIALSPRVPPP